MKKLVRLALILLLTMTLCSCGLNNKTDNIDEDNPYILKNGLTPTELIDKVEDFIIDIYIPSSQEAIEKALNNFAELATESEINELRDTVGEYNKDKKASIYNLYVNMATPDNSSNRNYKLLVLFTVKLKEETQNIMIEFSLNNEGLIDSHGIWINNKI